MAIFLPFFLLLYENKNMIDKKKLLTIIGLIITIIAGMAIGVYLLPKLKVAQPSSVENSYSAGDSYSIVYLTTGEVYIGKLSVSSKMKLDGAYLLQTVKDAKDPLNDSFQLTPLSDAMWSPETLYLNANQVVFYGPIKDDSKAAEAIRSAKK